MSSLRIPLSLYTRPEVSCDSLLVVNSFPDLSLLSLLSSRFPFLSPSPQIDNVSIFERIDGMVCCAAPSNNRKAAGSARESSQGRAQRSGSRFKADISRLAMDLEARNGTGGNEEEYTNIYFMVGERRETATYKADQVTDMELKGKSI